MILGRPLLAILTFVLPSIVLCSQTQPNTVISSGSGSIAKSQNLTVPHYVKHSGVLRQANGNILVGTFNILISIYDISEGGTPVWQETQSITTDDSGRYHLVLGASKSDGISQEVFFTGGARWLGVQAEGEPEQPRTLLASVPYALKAADAETLGGKPLSAFVLASPTETSSSGAPSVPAIAKRLSSFGAPKPVNSATINSGGSNGTTNFVSKFDTPTSIVNSLIFDTGSAIGIGTTSPAGVFTVVSPLSVNDPLAQFGSTGSSDSNSILLGNGSGTNSFFISGGPSTFIPGTQQGDGGLRVAPGKSVFFGDPFNPRMRIDGAGRVGIGTVSPNYKLELMDSSNAGFRVQTNTSGGTVASFGGFGDFQIDAPGVVGGRLMVKENGNVGIGNNAPAARLHSLNNSAGVASFSISTPPPAAIRGEVTTTSNAVVGVVGITSSPAGYGLIGENLATTTATLPNGQAAIAAGLYGVSLNSPDGTGVLGEALGSGGGTVGTVGVYGHSTSSTGTGLFGFAEASSGDAVGVFGRSSSQGGTGVWGEVTPGSGNNFGVYGKISSPNGAAGVFDNTVAGNVLIGRVAFGPGFSNVFRVDTSGKVFANSGLQPSGADFAESVSVLDQRSSYQPGDVIAIDTTGVRRFAVANKPYSTLVAGIYSTKPGILATPHNIDDSRVNTEEIPLAVVGIVPCKVTSENGVIQAGDLLVSSSTSGYAMKATDRSRMVGAIIGKALQPMTGKTGVIEVLVSLQ